MLFNSYIFIMVFLPLCITGYFILNHFQKYNLSQIFLLIMSLWFYGYFNPKYLLIIIFSVLFNYGIYTLLCRTKRKLILCTGIFINIALLFFFKYTDFFLSSINSLFKSDFNLLHIVLPLGISFFTFQQISFIVDAYRGEVPKYKFLHYASYVTYFPQLIAGPIVTHDELIPQFLDSKNKKLNWENLAKGIYIFTLGLSKKVLIADVFGNIVNWGFSNYNELYSADAIIVMLSYTFQIYFDFSGYCDMATGIAKMMNIELPVNFNSPYKAFTITEFWDRWHITLTRFFTKYVYIPLGGNRKGNFRTYLNIFIVFFISGFWHGAGVTFIFWGICHGIFSIIIRKYKDFFKHLHPALNWLITFSFLNITWTFFRADSCKQALKIIHRALRLHFERIQEELVKFFKIPEFEIFLSDTAIQKFAPRLEILLFFSLAFFIILGSKNTHEKMADFTPIILRLCTTAFLMALCICSFSGISIFLYWDF